MTETLKTKNVFLTGGAQGLGKSYLDGLLAKGARLEQPQSSNWPRNTARTTSGSYSVTSQMAQSLKLAMVAGVLVLYGQYLELQPAMVAGVLVLYGQYLELQPAMVAGVLVLYAAFQTGVDHLGYVDLMVNNAGIMNESVWEKMIQLNYTGVVRGTLLAYEHMRKDKGGRGGRIVNISSGLGLVDASHVPVYCGTKHAIRAFTSSLAMAPDVHQLGLEYGALCPGAADTDLIRKIDGTRIRHIDSFPPDHLEKTLSP
ncbi:hypothetical protein RRG08_066406 [Elysia crispata]|uniref:15-hydroxyprostaglandin dehydrogenase [NAD(+)] n=1 Tax=Elysia crispata TaxID=231223 RepID=A0AAE0YSL4_9GAST|nr:hypothetical protein RRG08_066406 [Elysia crispata]